MNRKLTALILCLALVSGLGACGSKAEVHVVDGNLLKLTTEADFSAGAMENLELVSDAGNGAVALAPGALEGSFTSATYDTANFYRMVASWNASIYDGGSVEVWARVKSGENWTEWLSWGEFSPFIQDRGSSLNKKADGAYIDQDIFICSKSDATQLEVKAVLKRDSAEVKSPVLRQVTMTFSGGEMIPTYAEEMVAVIPEYVYNRAPAYAQGIRHAAIGGSICSPVTMTVMMNSRVPELDILPEEFAVNIEDRGEGIFGNWSFTSSGGGLYGFESYCQYADLSILLNELAQGRTVGLSVKYSPGSNDGYPRLDGSYGPTAGHLITLIGYEYEGGSKEEEDLYFYSSDSYSAGDDTSYHRYSWKQLSRCWESRIAYIIPSLTQEVGGDLVTGVVRVDARLLDNNDGTWTLADASGKPINMSRFMEGYRVVGCTADGIFTDMMSGGTVSKSSVQYSNPMQVSANNTFAYIVPESDGTLRFTQEQLREKLGAAAGTPLTFYFMSDYGYCYIARLEGK